MLRIKDNVDLKELEKYGFKPINYINQRIYKLYTDKELSTGQMNTLFQAVEENDQDFFKLKKE